MGGSCCRQSNSFDERELPPEVHGLQYLCGLHGKVGPPSEAGKAGNHKDVNLPCLLLSGKQVLETQQAFAMKPSELRGLSPVQELTRPVGVVCQKGFKMGLARKVKPTPNQDDFFAIQSGKLGIYGVFDGHGPCGHKISNFVSASLPKCLALDPYFQDDTLNAIGRAFAKTQGNLQYSARKGRFDSKVSGSTATLLVVQETDVGSSLYVAHVGDSRAVLALSRGQGSAIAVVDLTEDHKPNKPSERMRIAAAGGVVRRMQGDANHRIFLKDQLVPGLAMSRSFGDEVAASVGASSTPELQEFKVRDDWLFVLICSDGVWEFMTSKEAVEVIWEHHPSQVQMAVEILAERARQHWQEQALGYVDDITVLCVWLHCGTGEVHDVSA